MDITMIGLQNAGKTSLLRVLAVSTPAIGNYHATWAAPPLTNAI
jgi:GTPase involved in cell partitioning and DNA repair